MINPISHLLAFFTLFSLVFTSPVPPFKDRPPSIKASGGVPAARYTTCSAGYYVNIPEIGTQMQPPPNRCLKCPTGQYNSKSDTRSRICFACLNGKSTCNLFTGL